MPSSGNDANTLLLLHCDGTDTSTSFPDASASARSITATGNAQVDTAQQKFGTGSYLGDGTGDFLSVPHISADDFGTGSFTLDLWVRFNSVSQKYIINRNAASFCDILMNSSSQVICYLGSVAAVTAAWSPSTATWYHIAFVRNGSACDFYVNGTSIGSGTSSYSVSSNDTWNIGALGNTALSFDGWFDEIRISNVARWTANFTPETTPYGQASVGIPQAIFF